MSGWNEIVRHHLNSFPTKTETYGWQPCMDLTDVGQKDHARNLESTALPNSKEILSILFHF
jgi:hypothetical protein